MSSLSDEAGKEGVDAGGNTPIWTARFQLHNCLRLAEPGRRRGTEINKTFGAVLAVKPK